MAKKNPKVTRRTAVALRRGQVQKIKEEIVASIERIQYPFVDSLNDPKLLNNQRTYQELETSIDRTSKLREGLPVNERANYINTDPTVEIAAKREIAIIKEFVEVLESLLEHPDCKITSVEETEDAKKQS